MQEISVSYLRLYIDLQFPLRRRGNRNKDIYTANKRSKYIS